MSEPIYVEFECGGMEIAVHGNDLLINGDWIAEFMDEDYAREFVMALDRYGEAMWKDGYDTAKEGE